jgi:hypothetical protein
VAPPPVGALAPPPEVRGVPEDPAGCADVPADWPDPGLVSVLGACPDSPAAGGCGQRSGSGSPAGCPELDEESGAGADFGVPWVVGCPPDAGGCDDGDEGLPCDPEGEEVLGGCAVVGGCGGDGGASLVVAHPPTASAPAATSPIQPRK